MHPDDQQIIQQIEHLIGATLEPMALKRLNSRNVGYALDEDGRVVGLSLPRQGIADVEPLSKLTTLQRLHLDSNQIVEVRPLSKLTSLQTLLLTSNQIVDVGPLSKLTTLKTLLLHNNQIVEVGPLSKLTSLQTLYLSNNEIVEVGPLSKLTTLQTLLLDSNQIVEVGPLSKLTTLHLLRLDSNQIEKLLPAMLTGPLAIEWGYDLANGVFLEGNPLKFPPAEIVQAGGGALASYRASVERGDVRAMNEVKVLLVGEGGSGKTSLVKRLMDQGFDPNESQTHGINIRHQDFAHPTPGDDPVHVRFWDFGGQEIMHATHQFFLSQRSVYVLVLDARKEEAAEYWLKHIESFGGASPVLVVVNKVDENPGFRLPRKQLQAKYPGICAFFRLSCAKPRLEDGIKAIREALTEALVRTPLFGSVWSEDWFNVKTRLEEMGEPYISYEAYQSICQEHAIEEVQTQDTLVSFLHDLGVVLHFDKFDLADTHVLDPEWVTQAVYKIINAPILAERHGLLRKTALRQILKRKTETDYLYPRDKHRFIIEIMKEFELCYEVDDDTILMPDLLDVAEPDFDFDFDQALSCILQYEFLPRSIMPRFIVQTHKAIKDPLRWRTGVVLEDDTFDCTAVVRSDQEDRRIFLSVTGAQKRD